MREKLGKINGSVIFFLIFTPIVATIVGYNYGYPAIIVMLVFFIGMYCYFNLFLNTVYSIKDKSLIEYRVKLIIYFIISVVVFVLSYHFYGRTFTLKPLLVSLILFVVQLFFIFK